MDNETDEERDNDMDDDHDYQGDSDNDEMLICDSEYTLRKYAQN